MARCWKRLKWSEDEEHEIKSDLFDLDENREEFASLPNTFKKADLKYDLHKAVDPGALNTKNSTHDDFESAAFPLTSSASEAELEGFEIKSGIDKLRELCTCENSDENLSINFDASNSNTLSSAAKFAPFKAQKLNRELFKFKTDLSRLNRRGHPHIFVIAEAGKDEKTLDFFKSLAPQNSGTHNDEISAEEKLLRSSGLPNLGERIQSAASLNFLSASDFKESKLPLNSLLGLLQSGSPYKWKSFHFRREELSNELDLNSLNTVSKSWINRTPVHEDSLSQIVRKVVQSYSKKDVQSQERLGHPEANGCKPTESTIQLESEERLNLNSKRSKSSLLSEKWNGENSTFHGQNENSGYDVTILEFFVRKRRASALSSSSKLLQKPSKFPSWK